LNHHYHYLLYKQNSCHHGVPRVFPPKFFFVALIQKSLCCQLSQCHFLILLINFFILFSAHTPPHMLKFFSTITKSRVSLSNCRISPHHLILLNSRTFFLSPPFLLRPSIFSFPLFLFLNFSSFLLCQYSIPLSFSSSTSPLLFLLLYSFAFVHILFPINILFFFLFFLSNFLWFDFWDSLTMVLKITALCPCKDWDRLLKNKGSIFIYFSPFLSNFLWSDFWNRITAGCWRLRRFAHARVATIGLEVTALFFFVF